MLFFKLDSQKTIYSKKLLIERRYYWQNYSEYKSERHTNFRPALRLVMERFKSLSLVLLFRKTKSL